MATSSLKKLLDGIEAETRFLLFFVSAGALIPAFILFSSGTHLAIATICFITAILSILFLLRWWAYRTRRLRNLLQVIKEFQEGDSSARVIISGNDELAMLEASYNELADQVIAGNEAIIRNDVLRRELIANISHDLRSPATSLRGFAETLADDSLELSEQEEKQCLSSVIRSARSLENLINDLFELTKLDAKIRVPTMSLFPVNEWLDQVTSNFATRAKEKGIKISFKSSSEESKVYGDLELLERAIGNLIGNAINYTPKGGEVCVSSYKENSSYFVSVSDTGIGIPEEDVPFIFERFKRVDSDRSRKTGGVGLGLAITKKVLDLHESEVKIESKLGEGTTISFDLSVS